MSRRPFLPSTYLVEWRHEGVVKAGYTAARRWASFVNRGATLHLLIRHNSGLDALVLEDVFSALLRRSLKPAFPYTAAGKARAVTLLGAGGGGYLECMTGDPAAVTASIAACREYARSNALSSAHLDVWAQGPKQCTNERNGRTNGDSPADVDEIDPSPDAHARNQPSTQDQERQQGQHERDMAERVEASA